LKIKKIEEKIQFSDFFRIFPKAFISPPRHMVTISNAANEVLARETLLRTGAVFLPLPSRVINER